MSQPEAEDELQIRRAVAADADAVRALTRAAYAKWVPVIGREPMPMAADYDLAVREHRIDLLYAGGALVALIEMVDRGDDLLIENVAVAPDAQRRGHGQRLLAHAAALAAELGRPALRLYTNPQFTGNVDLYARAGFAVEREEPFKDGTVVHMHKPVRPERPALSS
ncbi:ribosomal protein S18 acetylase RimI-like enzyme [Inquilinus ginsengisoli]|uniref:Ribosomal protein S18 acetylase RimI-like enzyme n=1 Tax=Inquilinus ginsengisoli TaxID=363840 RepID=A0ABU1JPC7_9PROT|nr:GNAT family N-acetyltransferase [Inquilinus ginsengisoli]MDR6290471.1 ribosomal protein S18 acetylase RimI-like enzyme [Inquilinus ginsengisoli]